MKRIISLLLLMSILLACNFKKNKMKAAINDHYREISLQTGAGSFNLSGVEILSVEENIVTAVIDGYHKNRSLPKLETSELKDTLLFIMENTKKGYRVIGVREKSKAK